MVRSRLLASTPRDPVESEVITKLLRHNTQHDN